MIIKRIEGFTRELGKSQGYIGLPLRDEVVRMRLSTGVEQETPAMVTAWEPTPDELQRLIAGAPVLLRVIGNQHPPVNVCVGEAPGEG